MELLYHMSEKKETVARNRYFATILYPDSVVPQWLNILEEELVPMFISPLHDKDINADQEQEKKAHYHLLIMFDSLKTEKQAMVIIDKIGGVGCKSVNSIRGYARYLCHLDNPEKYQYNIDDVISLCGADYLNVISLVTDKYQMLSEMQDFCEKYNVVSFYLLSKFARANRQDWYRILCDSGSVYMREYLKSKDWSGQKGYSQIINPETGEILI